MNSEVNIVPIGGPMNQRYNIEDGFDELFAVADGLYNDLKAS